MKPKNIQRAIGCGQSGRRAAGDAPSMGKIARAHTAGPADPARRRRTDQSQDRSEEHQPQVTAKTRRMVLAWSLLLAGVTALVLGGFLLQWFFPRMPDAITAPVAEAQIKVQPQPAAPPEVVAPSEEEAVAFVKKALAVRDVAQVATFFRLGSATTQAVVDFLTAEAEATLTEGKAPDFRWLGNIRTNGMSLEGVMLTSRGTGKIRIRLAVLIPDAAGKWQVDFDALAVTATPSWHELLENQAPTAQVRVFATPDNYYNGPFRDEGQWLCYSIIRPHLDTKLTAYARIGSPQAEAMAAMSGKRSNVFRTTLEIRRVAGAEARQFEISRVLAQDWVTGPTAFDEKSR